MGTAALALGAAPPRDGEAPFAKWRYFRVVALDTTPAGAGVAGDVPGFPLAVTLDATSFDFGQSEFNGEDVRFATREGRPLPHAIEHWDAAARRATVWVKLDVRGNDARQAFLMFWGHTDVLDAGDMRAVFDTRDGFVAAWHLGDLSGTAESGYRDATANAAHGTGVNLARASAVEGRLGRAVALSHAQGQWIKVEGEKRRLFDLTDKLTFSIWAKARSFANRGGEGARPSGYETMFAKGDSSWRLQKFGVRAAHDPPSDLVEICVERKEPRADLCVVGKTDMATDRWFHFTGVHDHPRVKLYVNGVLESIETFEGAWTSDDHPVGIGNQSQFPNDGRFWDGVLDEARVQGVVRDDHWIKLDYESQREGQALVKLGPVQERPPPER
jgi:biopolymer transport protein ExbB